MKKVRRIIKKIFLLPPLFAVPVFIFAFALVIFVRAKGMQNAPAYIAYFLSFYALTVFLLSVPRMARKIRKLFRKHPLFRGLRSIPLAERFLHDAAFRTEIYLFQGISINLLYIAIKLSAGVYYRSLWFLSAAIYYMLLVVMRFLLLRHINKKNVGKDMESELRRSRLCGIILLLMNQALAVIVTFIVLQNRGYDYPGLLIYFMAAYTFYSITIAVIKLISYRKRGSPVMSAARALQLVSALVSLLSLETAMITQFGSSEPASFRFIMTAASGAAICLFVLGMAVYMIAHSTHCLKKLHRNEKTALWEKADTV